MHTSEDTSLSARAPTESRITPWSWLLLPVLALIILSIDQYTKHLIRSSLHLYEVANPILALSHLFNLTFVKNTGAAFGLFPNGSTLFVIIAVVVTAGIALYFRHIPRGEWLLKISLAMQFGGAMGNLLDRVRLGYVVDFVDFHMWPVFNFADTFIVVGVLLLAYRLLFYPDQFQFADVPSPPAAEPQDDGNDLTPAE